MPAFLTIAGLKITLGRAWGWITASASRPIMMCIGVTAFYALHEHHVAEKWHHAADLAMKALDDAKVAQVAAAKAQRAVNDAAHEKSRQIATTADRSHDDALTDARRSTDAYAASHGLRATCAGGSPGGTDRAAQDGGAGVPASLPADSVVVSAADLQAATDAVTYAIAAHNLAADQIAAGLAE